MSDPGPGCCAAMPSRGGAAAAPPPAAAPAPVPADAVAIPGGRAEVGTDRPLLPVDGEGPRRLVTLRPFRMDPGTVTNARFARFVERTGYVTEAERFGWSFVFQGQAPRRGEGLPRVAGTEWWCRVEGASWRAPGGPGPAPEAPPDHPVVHVSHADALAFAAWSGGRLPTEAEWEHAARGGLRGATFPWGDEAPGEDGPFPCNIWQGTFPGRDTGADGYAGTAPALSFPPNGYGLHNMCGNVWEWCADAFRVRSLRAAARRSNGDAAAEGKRVLKGGSFLCHRSYCLRYRIAARIGNPPDTSTGHIGFRLAYD